ncbi:hypothetical protein Daus18300_006458 [Diaporthe australafricana]|uniref:Uncharacterized protein n=1 Tax=Diaporthe australafricana TaxID=127596 RepID=A0ABR3WUA3_9PEZI
MTTPLVNGYTTCGPVGGTTQDLLNHVTGVLIRYSQNQPTGANWPLGPAALDQTGIELPTPEVPHNTQAAPITDRESFETIPLNNSLVNHVNFNGDGSNGGHETGAQAHPENGDGQGASGAAHPVQTNNASITQSSFEILGCVPQARRGDQDRAPSFRLSRPPSGMPDFDHVHDDESSHQELEPPRAALEAHESTATIGVKPLIQLVIAMFLFGLSLFSVAAAARVMTVTTEVKKTVTPGHVVWLVVSMVIFLSSAAVLCYVLRGSAAFSWVLGLVQAIRRTLGRARAIRWNIRSPFARIRRAARSRRRSHSHLPHPKEFELDDLEDQPWGRPPTPYPGPAIPVPAVIPQTSHRPLPFGFPSPPTGVDRVDSIVSRLTTISFQSDPRSVSPLSDDPPTPPPKPAGLVSRFQSREPLLPHTTSGASMGQSNRASILTTLCDAVQASNPSGEDSSTGNAAIIQSPQPAYRTQHTSPSRFREHDY